MRTSAVRPPALAALLLLLVPLASRGALNPDPPTQPVKLIFIHHSTGENWISDGNGDLGLALMNANYFVSDTNYGWGPADADAGWGTIGDHTDIGNFYSWFSGPNRDTYLAALYPESGQNSYFTRLATDPGGDNTIVVFKSCFPNSALGGSPSDPIPDIESNPLIGQDAYSADHTIANVKGIYRELLNYFGTRTDKLFVLVTAPPLDSGSTDATQAANARALNDWLVTSWLASYPYRNVFVFDFYNVMTSNGGDPDTNDLGSSSGNHHRYQNSVVEHTQTVANHTAAYSSGGDSHPTSAGNQKATGEFPSLLNIAYHCWKGDGSCTRPGMGFYVLPPCRVVDTRWASGPFGGPALAAGASRTFAVQGQCGVPADAVSVATNLTVTQPQAAGSLSSYPGKTIATGTSVVSFGAGRTRATNAALVLAADGSGGTVLGNSSAGSVHVILDVTGYWK